MKCGTNENNWTRIVKIIIKKKKTNNNNDNIITSWYERQNGITCSTGNLTATKRNAKRSGRCLIIVWATDVSGTTRDTTAARSTSVTPRSHCRITVQQHHGAQWYVIFNVLMRYDNIVPNYVRNFSYVCVYHQTKRLCLFCTTQHGTHVTALLIHNYYNHNSHKRSCTTKTCVVNRFKIDFVPLH